MTLLNFTSATVSALFLFFTLMMLTGEPFLSERGGFAGALLTLVLSASLVWHLGETEYRRFFHHGENKNPLAAYVLDSGLFLIGVVALVGMYSLGVYPSLLPSYEGGRPQKLSVVMTPALVEPMRTLGLCKEPPGSTCGPLQLVLETPQAYFVIVPESKAADGKKSGIKSVRLPKSDFLALYE